MADQAPNTPQVQLPGLADTNEPWALESTLNKVLQVLQKDFTQGSRQTKSIDSLNRNVDRLIRNLDRSGNSGDSLAQKEMAISQQSRLALKDIQKNSRRQAAAQEEMKRNQKQSKNAARDNLLGGGGRNGGADRAEEFAKEAWRKASAAVKGIADNSDAGGAMSSMAGLLPGILGTMGTLAVKMTSDVRGQMAQMAKTGQNFTSNMVDFANAAASGAVTTAQAASILSENSEMAAKIGSRNFLALQRQVRSTTEKFGRFGLSVEDQSKVMSGFMEIQMLRGRRDQMKSASAISDFTAQMSGLAKLTGKSIDELMKTQKNLNTDVDVNSAFQRIFQRFGPEAAKNAEEVFNKTMSVLPEQSQGAVKDMMSSFGKFGSVAQSKMGQYLLQVGKGNVVNALDKAIKTKDTSGFLKALRQVNDETQQRNSTVAQKTGDLGAAGALDQETFAALRGTGEISDDVINGINANLGDKAKKDNKGTGKAGDLATYDQNQTVVQEQLGKAYANILARATELLPGIQAMTVAAAQVVEKIAGSDSMKDAIQLVTNGLMDLSASIPGWLEKLSFLDGVGTMIVGLFSKLSQLGGMVTGAMGLGTGLGQLATLLIGAGLGKKAIGSGLRAGARALFGGGAESAGGAAARGGLRGLAAGGARGLLKTAGRGMGIGALIEGFDYLTGEKKVSWRNVAKSGLSLAGGALGGIGGGVATGGLGGEFVGGALGYAAGKKLGDWLLGPDEAGAAARKPAQRAPANRSPLIRPVPNGPRASEAANQRQLHETRMANQDEASSAQMDNYKKEIDQISSLYAYKREMEKIYFNLQFNYAKIRHNYEMALLNSKYQVHNATQKTIDKTHAASADSVFRTQVDQAKNVRRAMDVYQDKAAKMGALSQAGVIVQPAIGDDIGSQQLQEMKLTNQFLFNIYDIQRGTRKFKPLVEIYQSGL